MQRVSDIAACFRMLAVGRVRYGVTGENTGFEGMRGALDSAAKLRMSPLLLAELPVHLMFPRKDPASPERLAAFNQALRRLRAAGQMQKLEQQVPAPGPGLVALSRRPRLDAQAASSALNKALGRGR